MKCRFIEVFAKLNNQKYEVMLLIGLIYQMRLNQALYYSYLIPLSVQCLRNIRLPSMGFTSNVYQNYNWK